MNYFLGFFVSVYITYFVFSESTPANALYAPLYNFLVYQLVIFFIGIALSVFIYFCMKSMNSKVSRAEVAEQKKD